MSFKYGFLGCVTVLASAFTTTVASAAPPEIAVTQGAVASSINDVTYAPVTKGPTSFQSSGACPRWSGVVSSTNLGDSPIASNITASKLDAGDTVTFAMAIQNNSADGNAFDVALQAAIPNGFELPGTGSQGANLCATYGNGSSAGFTTQGAGFFGPSSNDSIELTDSASGSIGFSNPTTGGDVVIITFDLVVSDHFIPGSAKTLTSEVLSYSDSEGGSAY